MKNIVSMLFISVVLFISGCSTNVDNFKNDMKQIQTELENKTWENRIKTSVNVMSDNEVIDYFKIDDAFNQNIKNV